MFISPYDTLACRNIVMSKVMTAVERAMIQGTLITSENQGSRLGPLVGALPPNVGVFLEQSDAPQFAHPVLISPSSHNDHRTMVVIDGRNLARSTDYLRDGRFVPNNYDMFNFQRYRAAMIMMLVNNETSPLTNIISPVTKVTSLWIQRAVVRQFIVSQETAAMIQIVGAFYCYAMFSGASTVTSELKQLWAARLQRDFPYFQADMVQRVSENIKSLGDVVQLVESIKIVANTPVLDKFNTMSFLQAIGSGWDVFTSREMMSVAIEHLPTLIAVIVSSQTQSFSKTGIGRHVKDVLGSNFRDFSDTTRRLVLGSTTSNR